MRTALKIALGVLCFGVGVACLILAICMLPFGVPFEAAFTGIFGAVFLSIAFLLLRQLRWIND